MSENIDLAQIFQTITQELIKNQQSLNQADGYNQNHGDNMVGTFQTITRAVKMKLKQGSTDSTALAYAAKRLAKSGTGASAQLYATGLSRAATQFQGKKIDQRSALQFLQTLIGGGQAAPQSAQATPSRDMLSSLLGGLMGGSTEPQAQQSSPAQGGGLPGGLLGGLTGGSESQNQQEEATPGGGLLGSILGGMTSAPESGSGSGLQDGLDLGDLVALGMAFMQQKQLGKNTLEALVQAFMQMSGMGNSKDRTQSTELVVSSFLQSLLA